MTEHKKGQMGLQKDVSSIFKGVPIPQKDRAKQPSAAPAPQGTDSAAPKPASPDNKKPQVPLIQKLQQPTQLIRKDTSGKQLKVKPAVKITGPGPRQQVKNKLFVPKPASPDNKRPQVPLIQKLQQPTQLIRKDTPGKQLKVKPAVKITGPGPWQQVKNKFFAPKPGVSTARQKATAVLVPVLGIVFVFALRQIIGTTPRKTKGALENNATNIVTVVDSDNVIDWQIPKPYPATLRDPVQLGPAGDAQDEIEIKEPKTVKTTSFIIKGILYSTDNPSAIIGNQIVHEGDKVSGATVVKIEKNSVEFKRNGQRWKQRIRE